MSKRLFFLSTILAAGLSSAAYAQDSVDDRIEKLEQEIKILKRQTELDKEETAKTLSTASKVDFGKRGFVVLSPDGERELRLRGNFQFDTRTFFSDSANSNDEILARRLRPILDVKLGDFSLHFMPDFAGASTRIFNAHADYAASDALKFRIGKFKTPISLERLQSQSTLTFVERGHPTSLAPSRDFGAMVYGDLLDKKLEYQAGVFNGNPDYSSADGEFDDNKDFAARLFAHPFRKTGEPALEGLGFGIAGSTGDRDGSVTNTILGDYRTPGQQAFFRYRTGADGTFADGTHWRLYPQAYYYYGPFGLMTEYAHSSQAVTRNGVSERLNNSAWQVAASWVLTGEDASYEGVKPAEPFSLKNGGAGAWEIAARAGELRVDSDAFPFFADPANAAEKITSLTAGLNWYLNDNVKTNFNYDHSFFEGGAASGADRDDEQVVMTRVQFRF